MKNELEQQQKARLDAGLPPIKLKERECLTCRGKFISEGIGNRMCQRCRYEHKDYGGSEA